MTWTLMTTQYLLSMSFYPTLPCLFVRACLCDPFVLHYFSVENVLVRYPAICDGWYKAVVRLLQRIRSEAFFAWVHLEHVEAAVIVGELPSIFGYSG
ncbi:hypothetical protein F5146DRAFT_774615 [Armillaria mellea]|nr:hypothetical protein F5146DRAFT_774615 [Armillaria mellea]